MKGSFRPISSFIHFKHLLSTYDGAQYKQGAKDKHFCLFLRNLQVMGDNNCVSLDFYCFLKIPSDSLISKSGKTANLGDPANYLQDLFWGHHQKLT